MKKLFFALVAVLFATSVVAQTGLTCNDPIPVDKNYKGRVDGPCELWYTANTYDLPLNVYFSPDSVGSKLSPEVYVDFSCTPGVYDDRKLDSLLNKASVFGVELPLEFMCDGVFRNGKNEWDLSVSNSYREQLAESGIIYNLKALIRVVYYESGSISLTPDTSFASCMGNEYVELGDTLEILPNDSNRVFVMPFSDWQNDSIRFVWEGGQEANVWLAVQYCEFTPDNSSSFVWGNYQLTANDPHKLQSAEIADIIKNHKNGGVYYGKVIAPVAGKFVVEKIPMTSIKGGATLLEYGKSVEVNDENQLFCFPRIWGATEFISTTNKDVTMYMSAGVDFMASATDANLIACHTFSKINRKYYNYISSTEMKNIVKSISDDYVYVRFQCAAPTTIVVESWDASSCANKSLMIRPNQQFSVAANSENTIYRMLYDDWKRCNVMIKWTGNSRMYTYIADTCSFTLSSTSSRVLQYANIKSKGTFDMDAETIGSWESRVDADGFLYVRFKSTNKGNVTFVAEKLEEPTNECVESSIKLNAGDEFVVNLDSAFTVYCINYAEWVNKNITFRWSGEESLHTFVAETCQFAVAPYNKYVVNYITIPANGELVLDAAKLSEFADKVDDAGYLYIRFLTEKEGFLIVE